MKSLANWLTVMFMGMYFIFRIIVCAMAYDGKEFITQPIDLKVEIFILFVTLVCIILVMARIHLGGIVYCVAYWGYFGATVINQVMNASSINPMYDGIDLIVNGLGMVLPIIVIMDMIIDKSKAPVSKKSEWFYTNSKYDREYDERADKNNYKLL